MLVSFLFIIIFAIIGTNFLRGTFFSCNVGHLATKQQRVFILEKIDSKFDCLNFGGSWENAEANFDNVAIAALTLF